MREPGPGGHDDTRPALPGGLTPARGSEAFDTPFGEVFDPTVEATLAGFADDEFDSPAEVDAAFTTQRRLSLGYFAVFLVVTVAAPTLSLTLGWWSQARIAGGMSPNFLTAAIGLYVFFFLLGLWAAKQAQAVEDRMLGTTQDNDEEAR